MNQSSPLPEVSNKERLNLYILLGLFGFGLIAASPRANSLKANLNISNQLYGTLVSLGAVGAIIALLFASNVVHKFGSKKVLYFSTVLTYLAMGIIPHIHRWWLYLLVNMILGFFITGYNTASFSLIIARQNETGDLLMPGFQGSWSIGVIITSLLAYLIAPYVSFAWHIDAVVISTGLLTLIVLRALEPSFKSIAGDPNVELDFSWRVLKNAFSLDHLIVVGFSFGILMEFVAGDWTTLVVHQEIKASITSAIGVYFIFILAMIIGRLSVPQLLKKGSEVFWIRWVTSIGGAVGLIGMQLGHHFAISHHHLAIILELIAFFGAGIGTSIVSPIFTNAAARRAKARPALALSQLWFTNTILNTILRLLVSGVVGFTSISFALVIPTALLFSTSFFTRVLKAEI